jgi:hypothetical protein
MTEEGAALSLGFDEDQIGWALRYIREAETWLEVAKNASSASISQEFAERALSQSFRAFYKLLYFMPLVDPQSQMFRLRAVMNDPIVRLSNLFRVCLEVIHEGKLSPPEMTKVGEALNGICLFLLNSVSDS